MPSRKARRDPGFFCYPKGYVTRFRRCDPVTPAVENSPIDERPSSVGRTYLGRPARQIARESDKLSTASLPRDWPRAIKRARTEMRLAHPLRISGAVTVAALNVLWRGHGVLRASPSPIRFVAVGIVIYAVTALAE